MWCAAAYIGSFQRAHKGTQETCYALTGGSPIKVAAPPMLLMRACNQRHALITVTTTPFGKQVGPVVEYQICKGCNTQKMGLGAMGMLVKGMLAYLGY